MDTIAIHSASARLSGMLFHSFILSLFPASHGMDVLDVGWIFSFVSPSFTPLFPHPTNHTWLTHLPANTNYGHMAA